MKRNTKMIPIVTGMMIASRWRARSKFSNCPPHANRYPGGSETSLASRAWASATNPP